MINFIIILAQKPIKENYASNCFSYGCGGLNIDDCRVPLEKNCRLLKGKSYGGNRDSNKGNSIFETNVNQLNYPKIEKNGRWPTNLWFQKTKKICDAFPKTSNSTGGNASQVGMQKFRGQKKPTIINAKPPGYNDSGSAERYYKGFKK